MADKLTQQSGRQIETRAGGKNGFSLVFDSAAIPSRGASLATRARWAHGYIERFLAGDKMTVKNLKLASKWLGELVNEFV